MGVIHVSKSHFSQRHFRVAMGDSEVGAPKASLLLHNRYRWAFSVSSRTNRDGSHGALAVGDHLLHSVLSPVSELPTCSPVRATLFGDGPGGRQGAEVCQRTCHGLEYQELCLAREVDHSHSLLN